MRITHSVDINRPPHEVWEYLVDTEQTKRWMKGLLDDVPTSEGPTRVGSTFRMSIKEGRKVTQMDGEVLEFDEHERLTVRMTGGCMKEGMSMTADYRLSLLPGGGTRVSYIGGGELTGLWSLLAPLMGLFCRMQIKGCFRALKQIAENDATAVTA